MLHLAEQRVTGGLHTWPADKPDLRAYGMHGELNIISWLCGDMPSKHSGELRQQR